MEIERFNIEGPLLLKPRVFTDDRGYFLESYNKNKFKDLTGVDTQFIQDNESKSNYGTLRGFHYQKPPYAQAKLVRVVKGKVNDVIIDLRSDSNTYGQHISVILSEENKHQLFVPRGFAHSFLVLEDQTIFSYKVDNKYAPDHDSGIIWNDPSVKFEWPIEHEKILLSAKDSQLQTLNDYKSNPDFK